MTGVDEMTVRLTGRSRRRVRRALGGFGVAWFGLGVAAAVASLVRDGSLTEVLIVAGFFLAIGVPAVLYQANLTTGSTRVGPAGLRVRGLFTGGFIAWDEVAEIKDRRRGRTWIVEARLISGRTRRLPGFFCEGPSDDPHSRPKRDNDFDAQLTELGNRFRRWQRSAEAQGR